MRSPTAIICLLALFVLQYGKLVSYWQCRIVNFSAALPCDCEKKLLLKHSDEDTHRASAISVKEKIEEIIWVFEPEQPLQPAPALTQHFPRYNGLLPNLYQPAIFQPPQLR